MKNKTKLAYILIVGIIAIITSLIIEPYFDEDTVSEDIILEDIFEIELPEECDKETDVEKINVGDYYSCEELKEAVLNNEYRAVSIYRKYITYVPENCSKYYNGNTILNIQTRYEGIRIHEMKVYMQENCVISYELNNLSCIDLGNYFMNINNSKEIETLYLNKCVK